MGGVYTAFNDAILEMWLASGVIYVKMIELEQTCSYQYGDESAFRLVPSIEPPINDPGLFLCWFEQMVDIADNDVDGVIYLVEECDLLVRLNCI